MSGFVYILSNPVFEGGRIKIGSSKSDPRENRKDELYTTGVPEPFKVEYFAFVDDYESVETKVHSFLDSDRPNKKREFFTCSVERAIIAIQQHADIKYEEVFYLSPEKIEAEARAQEIEVANKKREERLRQQKENAKIAQEKRRSEVLQKRTQFVDDEWHTNQRYWWQRKKIYLIVVLIVGGAFSGNNYIEKSDLQIIGFLLGAVPTYFAFHYFETRSKNRLTKIAEQKFPLREGTSGFGAKTLKAGSRQSNQPEKATRSRDEVVRISICPNCGTKNRLSAEKVAKAHLFKPICSICKSEL